MSIRKERARFEKLVLPHTNALYGSAYRLSGNAGDAEDLVQETMLRAYRSWHSFTKGLNCKAWLFKILSNAFITSYQRKKRSGEILNAAVAEQQSTDGVLVHEKAQSQLSPEELLVRQSLSEDVERALASIPNDFRVAVVLCGVEGFSYKEISEILECPVGTVMSRLSRGRRLLQKELREFAMSQGLLKDEESSREGTINLAEYRRSQEDKVSQS
ncbi:MAG: sigma-70 family RNA polymerase sigma factor [Myxococcales bacterium]|nr:sigma-70 family RNA polymerase sigma factor [Myxococcales bacterium]